MWFQKTLLLVCFVFMGVEACRMPSKDYPPDAFPEHGDQGDQDGDSQGRKKRHVVTNPHDVDHVLSDFFTTCLFDKTGSVFSSWRAVVDFVLRDTRWYSASDEQFCKRNYDREIPVECWQNRFEKLVALDSKLLPKAKECMQEYAWSKETPIRGKRGLASPGGPRTTLKIDVCLGISTKEYGSCVEDNLLTRKNIAMYGSLKEYNQKSIDDFVSDHYSECRITSRYNRFTGNVYMEDCPIHYLNPSFNTAPRTPTCLSTTFKEIVRTSSPLFAATKTCIQKYSNDKCKNVKCWRPYEQCDPSTGRCICRPGYEKNNRGTCVEENKCRARFCSGLHKVCDPDTGNCVCKENYVLNARGDCVMLSRCALIFCGGQYKTCDERTGLCVCMEGYVPDGNGICREQSSDPCRRKICGVGEQCVVYEGSPFCVCMEGYERIVPGICRMPNNCRQTNCGPNGRCRMRQGRPVCFCNPGYIRKGGKCEPEVIDPCATVRCGRYMECKVDQFGAPGCVCIAGYVPDPEMNGVGCKRPVIDPCATVRCGRYMECKVDQFGAPGCVCIAGYVPDPEMNGVGCKRPDPCDNVDCGPHGRCVRNGNCVCNPGYRKVNGRCVDPCENINCGPNGRCVRGRCICDRGFVEVNRRCVGPCDGVTCPDNSACSNGNCVCDSGFSKNSDGECIRINPCDGVTCERNQRCVRQTGQCVCIPNFIPNPVGPGCVPRGINPCDGVTCERNQRCVRRTGQCVCLPNFIPNPVGPGCVPRDRCAGVTCTGNKVCDNGNCVCASGFRENADGECTRISPCEGFRCPTNMRCQVRGEGQVCVCLPGFIRNPTNAPGCIRDACAGISCPDNSVCINGDCICQPPLRKDESGQCVSGSLCDNFPPCGRNEECRVNSDGLPECQCMSGFIRNPRGSGCIADPCSTLDCGDNSVCVRGRCRCSPGFRENDSGNCVSFDVCEDFCGENEDCEATSGRPRCFCKAGFTLNEFRECVPSTTDPCDGVTCGRNMDCRNGNCFCRTNFIRDPNGNGCVTPVVRCGGTRCDKNMVCQNNRCECASGHVPDPSGGGCEQITVTSCDRVQCERNMECKDGRCVCRDGFVPTPPGERGCQRPTSACTGNKIFNACPTMCPQTCQNRGTSISCAAGCRPGVTCVCRPGQVETSSTDSTCRDPSSCPASGPCESSPCLNGGVCSVSGNGYSCQCRSPFSGTRCERGCTAEFCGANGSCANNSCRCNNGFFPDGKGGCSP
uniref:neurogenic locus notch homolog protein 3-like isoform X3 n=1 Tax=Styela clava TaxID=7725 RepID=UPI0019393BF8|nr:neurogenic locus notch homolog protein 3-like isoform X3 [Styela clava]